MKNVVLLCGLLGILALPMIADACMVQYSVTVTASFDGKSFTETFSGQGKTDAAGYLECTLVDKLLTMGDDGAEIEKLVLKMNADPEVGVEFGVRAGSSATTYSVLSDVVTFDTLVNPTAYASAGVSLTDRNSNGAQITGLFSGGKVHQARYNSSSVYANLVNGFSVANGGSSGGYEDVGTDVISGSVSSIESEFRFTLSARDSASGTSTFAVIPEPATIAILAIGALSLIRKK
ncbi:MAG: hypothetical protein LLF92_10980 [Planctomycetaceae bacterium]|nr:hypothetical protein [Planctomycetaceae bacterium]